VETLKRLTGYMPEVKLAKAIFRWVKSQPAPEGPQSPAPGAPETR
jgi:hypothetical protein